MTPGEPLLALLLGMFLLALSIVPFAVALTGGHRL